MSRNLSALSYRKGLDHNLFEELGALTPSGPGAQVNGQNGGDVAGQFIGQEGGQDGGKEGRGKALEQLAADFLVGTANVYGSTTFYDFLKPENQGKEVYVCNGSACLTAGTQPALEAALAKLGYKFNAGSGINAARKILG
jgi:NADH-quinone oxidoreductase subunit F